MDVQLTPEVEALIRRKVATGMYRNAAEVVHAALRLLVEDDEWKTDVRGKVRVGMEDLRAGRIVDGEEAVSQVIRDLRGRHG